LKSAGKKSRQQKKQSGKKCDRPTMTSQCKLQGCPTGPPEARKYITIAAILDIFCLFSFPEFQDEKHFESCFPVLDYF
jgi:hypothetical protein